MCLPPHNTQYCSESNDLRFLQYALKKFNYQQSRLINIQKMYDNVIYDQ